MISPLLLLAANLSAAPLARPTVAPVRLPAAPSFPVLPAPHQGRTDLPSKLPPLPLPLPVEVEAAADALPVFVLDWTRADDDGESAALVPVDPGPSPLPPSGAEAPLPKAALRELADLAESLGRTPVLVD